MFAVGLKVIRNMLVPATIITALTLGACAPQVVEVEKNVIVTQVVSQEVEKIVEVEKEVAIEVEVEKIVEKEVEIEVEKIVEKEVKVEVVVTAVPEPGRTLNVAMVAEPRVLEPSVDTIKPSLVIAMTMLETLAMNTEEGGFEPWLAESWEALGTDGWRLHLREGVEFHNGEPLDADAVIYSLGVYHQTEGGAKGWYNFITSAEKVDDLTVDLFSRPEGGAHWSGGAASTLPATLGFFFVFPPKYHAELGSDEFGQAPVGTGPWIFENWTKGVELTVVPNPDYWGKKPTIGNIHFRWADDASSRVALLETGDVDIAQNVPPSMISRVNNSDAARIETVKGLRKFFLRMNIEEGPTADVLVRKALNHAIDIESIIGALFEGRAYGRDTGFILEGQPGYESGRLTPYKYDVDLAKELLAEAGYPNGFDVTFHHTIDRYVLDVATAEAIAGQLALVGINVELIGLDPGAFFGAVSGSRLPGIHFSASAPLFMTNLYHPMIEFELNKPYGYGANEKTDAYTKQALAERDEAKQIEILHEFEDYVMTEHVPWVWGFHYQDIYGVSKNVYWTPRPDQIMDFVDVRFR